jgi:hypothetical protein
MAQLPVIQITPPYVMADDRSAKGNAFFMAQINIRRGNQIIRGRDIRRRFIQRNQKFNVLSGDILLVRLLPYNLMRFREVGDMGSWMHIIGDPRYPNYLYNMANLRLELILRRDANNEDIVFADWLPYTGVRYDVFVKKNAAGNPVSQGRSGTCLRPAFEFGYVFRQQDMFIGVIVTGNLHVREGLNNPHLGPRVAALLYDNEVIQGRSVKVWTKTIFLSASASVNVFNPHNCAPALQKFTTAFNKPVAKLIQTRQRMAQREIARRLRMFAQQTQRAYNAWIRQIAARQQQLMRIAGQQGMRAFQMAARRAYAATSMGQMVRFGNFQPMTLVGPPHLMRRMAAQELARMGTAVGRAAGDTQGLGQRIEAMAREMRSLRQQIQELKQIINQLKQAPQTANRHTNAGITPRDRKERNAKGTSTRRGSTGSGNGTTTKTDVKITRLWYEPFAFGSGLIIVLGETDKQIEDDMEDGLLTIKLNDNITDLREKRFTSEDDRLNNPRLFFFKKGTPPPGIQSFRPAITSQNSNKYNFIINTETRVDPMSHTISSLIKSTIIEDISIQLVGNTNLVQVTITLSKQCNSSASAFERNVKFKSERRSTYHSMSSVQMTRSGRSIEFRGNIHEDIISGIVQPGRLFIKFSNAAAVFQSDDYPIPDFYNNFDIQCRKLTDRY